MREAPIQRDKPLPHIGHRNLVYEDKNRQIYQVVADFGSFSKEYLVIESGQRVGVLVLRDGAVLLVRQYRLLLGDLSWEIPGGGVADGRRRPLLGARVAVARDLDVVSGEGDAAVGVLDPVVARSETPRRAVHRPRVVARDVAVAVLEPAEDFAQRARRHARVGHRRAPETGGQQIVEGGVGHHQPTVAVGDVHRSGAAQRGVHQARH